MNKEVLTRLLNLNYEMEGLIELALRRDSDTPAEIYSLIAEKAYMMANTAADAIEKSTNADTPRNDEDGLKAIIDERSRREPENDDAARELMADKDMMYLPSEEESSLDDVFDNSEPEHEVQPETQENPQPEGDRKPLKTFFSINDNYLYRRELFGNNASDYRASMNLIENMKSYAEAEDYFFSDLQWDAENPVVAAFMESLKKYFNQH